ncbi:vWA domain-containing protein [Kosmotoga pacifica]|uniref:vWA domain-containing protein n=1 Tax=Kosmotoga pacifica TaxID=1330330 RepID=UPI00069BF92B|nr:vWA domain-containing protein [Kosmotoga pacifica]
MKQLLLLFIFFFIFTSLFAQLNILSVDTSDFPLITLKISGEEATASSIQVYDGGERAELYEFGMDSVEDRKPLDIVFIIDNSGTMGVKIAAVKDKVASIAEEMRKNGYDLRFAVIGFGTTINHEFTNIKGSRFTTSIEELQKQLNEVLSYVGGADECQIRALYTAASYDFRKEAGKVLILITDEDSHQNPVNDSFYPRLIEKINRLKLNVFVLYQDPDERYEELAKLSGGKAFMFGEDNFEKAFDELFTLRRFTSTLSFFLPLSYPVLSSGDEHELRVRNLVTGSEATTTIKIPEESRTSIRIFEIDHSKFPIIHLKVSLNTYNQTLYENAIRIYEDYNLVKNVELIALSRRINAPVDIVFVLDTTASMINEIRGMVDSLITFTEILESSGLDARIGLITFGDELRTQYDLTDNFVKIKKALEEQYATGGGDIPENSLDAVMRISEFTFRKNAQKIVILITDAAPHYRGDGSHFSAYSVGEVREFLLEEGITFILVGPDKPEEFHELSKDVPGKFIEISYARARDFGTILNSIAREISSQYEITYRSPDPITPGLRRVHVGYGIVGDSTVYTILPPIDFEINSFIAKPFIVRPGGTVELRCTTYPDELLAFEWLVEAGEIIETMGNRAIWQLPAEEGAFIATVTVKSAKFTKKAEVVVMVQETPCE